MKKNSLMGLMLIILILCSAYFVWAVDPGETSAASVGTIAQTTIPPVTTQPTTIGVTSTPICSYGNKCKEIDEVWKLLTEKGFVAVGGDIKGKVWDPNTQNDPVTRGWKTFAEMYPTTSTTATTTTPIQSEDISSGDNCFASSDEATARSKLVSINFQGRVIQVHKDLQTVFEKVDREITTLGLNYAFNNVGTFNWRCTSSPLIGQISDSVNCIKDGIVHRSLHSYGIAIDINPSQNPFCVHGADGKMYSGTTECTKYSENQNKYYNIPDSIIQVFKNNGFEWGGDWESGKDYMHFQWKNKCGATGVSTASASSGSALTREQIELVFKYSSLESIEPALALAIIVPESSNNPLAISPTSCAGLMQICQGSSPSDIIQVQCPQDKNIGPRQCNANSCKSQSGYAWCDSCNSGDINCVPDDRFDLEKNIHAGIRILKNKLNYLSGTCAPDDEYKKCAVAAYNLGQSVIKNAYSATGKNGASWAEVYNKITITIVQQSFNSWTTDYAQSRITGLKSYVDKVYQYYLLYKGKTLEQVLAGIGTITDYSSQPASSTNTFTSMSNIYGGSFMFYILPDIHVNSQIASQYTQKAVSFIQTNPSAFVITTGDMISADNGDTNPNPASWNVFYNTVTQPLLSSSIPFFPVEGNHDAGYGIFWSTKVPELNMLWSKLGIVISGEISGDYSFNYEGWHFVILKYTFNQLSPQREEWLENDLKSNPMPTFVFGHIQLQNAISQVDLVATDAPFPQLLSVLKEYPQVKAYFHGHEHVYYKGKTDGIEEVTTGYLSNYKYHLASTPNQFQNPTFVQVDVMGEKFSVKALEYKNSNFKSNQYFDESIFNTPIAGFETSSISQSIS